VQDALGPALLESDRRYFELGARLERLEGATIAWMPGLEGMPAGCVVYGIEPAVATAAPDWLDELEGRLTAGGCGCRRLYLDGRSEPLEALLSRRGYRRREEIGWVASAGMEPERGDVALRPVASEGDWADKRSFHEACDESPLGYATAAEEWTAFERRKCETGRMQAYLMTVDGEVCGAIAAIEEVELLRVKNVIVHPVHQGNGIGSAAVRLLSQSAEELGKPAIGLFGLPETVGFYRRIGMSPATVQWEWIR